jgi:nanoRNase/pAp phosphatase (c-di-AMP/oligoRNAs hydrolase)
MSIKVLFHSHGNGKHCPDGFAAAWAAWKKFGDEATYIPCVYQQNAPTIERSDVVYIVDFSFPRDELLDMALRATVVVLDHHKTAQASLEGLLFARFNMNKSGAEMTWEYFFPAEPMPYLIRYIADRDLWKKELAHTEEIHRALQTFPQDFKIWDTLAGLSNYVDFMYCLGKPLYQKFLKEVEELAATAQWKTLDGHKILCTNTTNYSLVSDVLNLVCMENPETPFAANFAFQEADKIKFELRSVGEFDVSAVAKGLGGGGHKNAGGCVVSVTDSRIQEFLDEQ